MKNGLTILFVCGFAVFSVMVKTGLRGDVSPLAALRIGQPMPEFTLSDSSGKEYSIGKVAAENQLVAINFWASWCAPCRLEMPGFEKLYTARSGDGFVILAINEDEEREPMEKYLGAKPVSFPVLMDPGGALMKRFGVRALPTTILVGGDGKIRQVFEGMQEFLEFTVNSQLKTNATAK